MSIPWGVGGVLERLAYLLGYIAVDAKVGKVHRWYEAWRAALHITNRVHAQRNRESHNLVVHVCMDVISGKSIWFTKRESPHENPDS